MDSVHVNCPHCHQAVTVSISERSGPYGVRMIFATPGPSVSTLPPPQWPPRWPTWG